MRAFIKILSAIAQSFLLLEKSLANGHKDDMLKELRANRAELKAMREQLKLNMENKNA